MTDLIPWLQDAAIGTRATFSIGGDSLAPLARAGDRVEIERCMADDLHKGDIALVRRGELWSAVVVLSVRPLNVGDLRGNSTSEHGDVRGRVVTLHRGRFRFPRGFALRTATLALRGVLTIGTRYMGMTRGIRHGAALPRWLRVRRTGPIRVRRLDVNDAEALDHFARVHFPAHRDFLREQLRTRWKTDGIALGASDRRGRIIGFIYVDEYRAEGTCIDGAWLRRLVVAPHARKLGAGRLLIQAACASADALGLPVVYADVRETNSQSRRLLTGAGFVPAAREVSDAARRVLEAARPYERFVILERRRGSTGAG